jgi:hypothetical protein
MKSMLRCVAIVLLLGLTSGLAASGDVRSSLRSLNAIVAEAASVTGVTLRIDRKQTRPGGLIGVRIENRSSQEVGYSLLYDLARFDQGRWIRVSVRPVVTPRFVLEPGLNSPWQKLRLRRNTRVGLYRLRKQIDLAGLRKVVKATFRVS